MTAAEQEKLEELLRDPTRTNEQFNLLVSAYCTANPVIYNCFGGIEKHIALLLPDNILAQGGFIDMLNNTPYITDDDYKQSELIGWLYQYYIAERKDEVFDGFKKGKKAEAEDIPAATQIFTPNWIVKYMVENTVGRIYLDNNPYADDIRASMKYLVEQDMPTPHDALFRIENLENFKLLDPASGSGHILIEGFNLFYRMYLSEGYASRTAIENIFRKNIIGLDLDTRAKQLATFALLMTAAKLDKSFLDCKVMPRVLDFPEPFVYRGGPMKEFLAHYFSGGNQRIIEETEKALELMKLAGCLGSIMKFDISPETRAAIERSTVEWEKQKFVNPDIEDALPSMKVILALTDVYSSVVANPPYMGAGNMNEALKFYINNHYVDSKADLFSVFIEQMLSLTEDRARMSCITMEAWMFLSSFENLREKLLNCYYLASLTHLGWNVIGIAFGTAISVFEKNLAAGRKGEYSYLTTSDLDRDQNVPVQFPVKTNGRYIIADQNRFAKIPGTPVGYWVSEKEIEMFSQSTLKRYARPCKGIDTGENDYFLRLWFEVSSRNTDYHDAKGAWIPYNKGGGFRKWYGFRDYLIRWNGSDSELKSRLTWKTKKPTLRNRDEWFKESFTWSSITGGAFSARYSPQGALFDNGGSSLFSKDHLWLIGGLVNSCIAKRYFEFLAPTINYQPGDVGNIAVPNNLLSFKPVIEKIVQDNVKFSKLDWDAHETSWDFKKNELLRAIILCRQNSADMDMLPENEIEELRKTVPHDACKIDHCIRAYKSDWERKFRQLHSNEEELNRQFIEIYGLQDELTPDVPLDEITILQQGEISIVNNQIAWHDDVIVKQFLSYAIGCWMGRYRLDKEGLYIAHYPTDEEVCTYEYNGQSFEIDDDAIIPLMGRDNPFEDDNALQKTVNFVRIVFGEENLTENLNHIEHCLGKSVEDYLVKDFWKDHKKMYQNRPIYWLFSSKKGAFQVLVYMHRMNPYTAEKIRTKYLLPYIEYLKGRIEADEARGADLTTVERKNLAKMQAALAECTEYHDRLHDIAIKAIDFDLDDGVVVNYAKFGDVVAKIK